MGRNFEAYPGGREQVREGVSLPYPDEVLKTAVLDQEGSRILYDTSPVLWIRSAIAVGSEREPSDITDAELVDRLLDGGFVEWDPNLTHSITDHLQEQGYFIFN